MASSKCRRLEERVAVITGGGSGIGLATARRLADEGAKVVVADMDAASGQAAADDVGGTFVQVDVTNADDVARMFRVAKDTYGSIDVSFHNAGISPPDDDSILETGIDAWRRVQEVNLTSVYLCCKEVLPYMLQQGKGSIINTASFVATMAAATSQISTKPRAFRDSVTAYSIRQCVNTRFKLSMAGYSRSTRICLLADSRNCKMTRS